LHHFQAAVAQRALDLRGIGLAHRFRLSSYRSGRRLLRLDRRQGRLLRLDRSVQRLPRRFLQRGELGRRRAD
jgi:hypothetical protein